MNVKEFLKRYIYSTHNNNLIGTLQDNSSILWLMDTATQMLFSVGASWAVRSWQMRVIEAQNPGGNVLRFRTPHPIISGRVKFWYGEESVAVRFKEHECECEVDEDPISKDCYCYNVSCLPAKRNQIQLKEMSPWANLSNNSYKIYGWYAGWGNLGDRVEIMVCGGDKCCTAPGHSIYMEYAFWCPLFKTLHDVVPVAPAYLIPLSMFFKAALAPGWENWLAGQEQSFYQMAVDMVRELDKQDRTLNPKSVTA
jgi:hypothetical protein